MSFEHSLPFDPTYGHTLESLRQVVPPAPFPEFEAFWREAYAQERNSSPGLKAKTSESRVARHEVLDITYRTNDGGEIGGWLTIPREVEPVCAIVQSHGYGGRTMVGIPMDALPAIRLSYCTRGFQRSEMPDIPNLSTGHVIHGIESKESYVLRGCAADIWAAFSVLEEFAPHLAHRLCYSGKSFGGGIGGLATPWEERLWRSYLGQPTFGNHPIRLQSQCTGSGESVRLYSQQRPEVAEVLRYYDAAIAASYLKVPTLVSCSAFDPAVPPPGQFAVYNAIPCRKELIVEPAGHFVYEGQAEVLRAIDVRIDDWFSK